MGYKNYFKLGNKLYLETLDYKIDEEKELISQVLEICSNEEIIISMPIYNGNVVPISVNTEIVVYYSVDGRGLYYFRAKIIKRTMDNVAHFKIKQISNTNTIQRRNYFRLDLRIQVELYDEEKNLIGNAYTKDISGGGIKILLDKKLPQNKLIGCKFEIDNKEYFINSQILRSIICETNISLFEVSIKFLDINEATRSSIIGYIFEKQRIFIKKGLV